MKTLVLLSLALAGISYGQSADKPIQLEIKDFTPEQAAKLHARVCAHGPTHFCGPLISKTGTEQEQSAIVPKDAKSGHYCMWIEYDGGETELRQCFDVDESAPKQDPAKPAGQKILAATGTGQLRNDKLPARHIDAIKSRYPGLIDATIDLTSPLITNNWQDYMVPEFKSGSILYVPWPKLPIPSALRRNKWEH